MIKKHGPAHHQGNLSGTMRPTQSPGYIHSRLQELNKSPSGTWQPSRIDTISESRDIVWRFMEKRETEMVRVLETDANLKRSDGEALATNHILLMHGYLGPRKKN